MSIVTRGLGLPGDSLVTAGFGLSVPVEKTILSGDGYLEQAPAHAFGVGASFAKSAAAPAGGVGGNFSRNQPNPLQLVADVRRERAMDALGLRLVGAGGVEQAAPEVLGDARIKRVVLVASSAVAETGPGESGRTDGRFVDVELEMAALALALAA